MSQIQSRWRQRKVNHMPLRCVVLNHKLDKGKVVARCRRRKCRVELLMRLKILSLSPVGDGISVEFKADS